MIFNPQGEMKTITPPDVARLLNVDAKTVRKWIAAGLLPGRRFPGGRVRIALQDVEAFYASLPTTTNADIREARE